MCLRTLSLQGTWDQTACGCVCLSQNDPKANGYCPDNSGSCTIPKTYDDATESFHCPGDDSDQGGAPSTAFSPAPSPTAAPVRPLLTNLHLAFMPSEPLPLGRSSVYIICRLGVQSPHRLSSFSCAAAWYPASMLPVKGGEAQQGDVM